MTLARPAFARALAAWFAQQGRTLPWRETRDPYALWLSEIMLQQTQVATVLPYWRRFLAQWPTIGALAAAPDGEVMKAWEGLGYYARCRNLLKAARLMVAEHGGQFPQTLDGAQALPGVGRSTAGAILTFAFGQRHPLLDGNVRRVLCRLYDEDGDPTRAAVQRRLWERSEALLADAADPWVHNQALMDLGATVCTPREPDCDACPVAGLCDARAAGTWADRPVRKQRAPLPHKQIGVGVVQRDGLLLIQLRPPEGLLGGLWEFPGGKQEEGEAIEDTVRRELSEELGIQVRVGDLITRVRHTYSHFRITLHAYRCDLVSGVPTPRAAVEHRWVAPTDLQRYAFPKANKRVIDALRD